MISSLFLAMLRFFLSFILIVSIRADDAQINEVSDQRLRELDTALMNVPSAQKELW